MKVFSVITESVSNEEVFVPQDEFDTYYGVMRTTKRSKEFFHILRLIQELPFLLSKKNFEKVISGRFFPEFDVDKQKEIQKLYKKIGDESKVLPQMLSSNQRKAVIDKKINVDDLTLDLESNKGRDAIVKKYLPLVEKIVKQYSEKSNLSKEDLRSAALLGLVNAMDNYKNPEEMAAAGKEGNQSFTQYAAYRIKQQILTDMTNYGTNVKISNHFRKKISSTGDVIDKEFSIDSIRGKDEDGEPISIDRFLGLSEEDDQFSMREKQEFYEKIFKRIESKFSSRDCNMFYRVWGINGYDREKVKDIAKELGISEPAVTQACKRIIKFAAADKEIQSYKDAFESLLDEYVMGKLFEVFNYDKQMIIESLIFDDLYIFVESFNQYNSKEKLIKAINKSTNPLSVEEALFIYNILMGKIDIEPKAINRERGAIVRFLENLYPEKSFKTMNYVDIVTELTQLKSVCDNFKIEW